MNGSSISPAGAAPPDGSHGILEQGRRRRQLDEHRQEGPLVHQQRDLRLPGEQRRAEPVPNAVVETPRRRRPPPLHPVLQLLGAPEPRACADPGIAMVPGPAQRCPVRNAAPTTPERWEPNPQGRPRSTPADHHRYDHSSTSGRGDEVQLVAVRVVDVSGIAAGDRPRFSRIRSASSKRSASSTGSSWAAGRGQGALVASPRAPHHGGLEAFGSEVGMKRRCARGTRASPAGRRSRPVRASASVQTTVRVRRTDRPRRQSPAWTARPRQAAGAHTRRPLVAGQ